LANKVDGEDDDEEEEEEEEDKGSEEFTVEVQLAKKQVTNR
jgi:hypothetical protein